MASYLQPPFVDFLVVYLFESSLIFEVVRICAVQFVFDIYTYGGLCGGLARVPVNAALTFTTPHRVPVVPLPGLLSP